MIRNNLSILLSERSMKSTALSIKTGISKNTISSITQNDGKMIQLETINKICQILEITPGDFFSYIPFDFEFIFSFESFVPDFKKDDVYEIYFFCINEFKFDFYIKVLKGKEEVGLYEFCPTITNSGENLLDGTSVIDVKLTASDDLDEFEKIWTNIPLSFRIDITKEISNEFYEEVYSYLEKYFNETLNGEHFSIDDKEFIKDHFKDMVTLDFDPSNNPFNEDPFKDSFIS